MRKKKSERYLHAPHSHSIYNRGHKNNFPCSIKKKKKISLSLSLSLFYSWRVAYYNSPSSVLTPSPLQNTYHVDLCGNHEDKHVIKFDKYPLDIRSVNKQNVVAR